MSRFSDRMVADVGGRLGGHVEKLLNLSGGTGFGKARRFGYRLKRIELSVLSVG